MPAVLLMDASTRVVAASRSVFLLVGREAETLRGIAVGEMFEGEVDQVHRWIQRLPELREPPPPLLLEFGFVRGDGTRLAFDAVCYAIRVGPAESGECVAGVSLRPSTGLVDKGEMLTAQRRVIEGVAAGADPAVTFGEIAAFAERVLPGEAFCMISPVSPTGEIGEGVARTLPADVTRLQKGLRARDVSTPGAVAVGSGQSLIATDLSVEEGWRRYAESLQRHGLIAVWSRPVDSAAGGGVRALVEIMLPVRRPPSRAEVGLIEELAELVRLAIDLQAVKDGFEARGRAQQAAEAVAQQRREHLDAVVNTSLDAVISIDAAGMVTLWNLQAQVIFGWTSDETVGQPLSRFIIPPELVEAHESGLRRYRETGHGPVIGKRIEITARDRAGRRFPVELSINRIPGTEGACSAFLRDITVRRQAEQALKASEERLNLVVEAASDGFWDFRLDGGPSLLGARCAAMLGREPGTVSLAMPPEHPLIHPEDRAAVREAWDSHLRGAAPRYESEHRRLHADGSWRWILERGKVVERDAAGLAQRIVGTQTDVTERRALEAGLTRAGRLESLGLIAGGFAQELDGVLSVILAHASLASVSGELPPRARESLEVVQLSVAKARAMARSLRQIAPEAGVVVQREKVRAMDVVREAVQIVRPALPRTVEVSLEDLSREQGWVHVDTAGFQQAVVNLLLHACDNVANAGRVSLRVEAEPSGRVTVACRDDGPAASQDFLGRAFEAVAADGSLLGRSALGMASVRRFAESMGGRATAAVTGEGNRIAIELPMASDPATAAGVTVILHEDHPLLRPMLSEAMVAAGHLVVNAVGPTELAQAWASHPEAILVIDDQAWEGLSQATRAGMTHAAMVFMAGRPVLPDLPPGAAVLRKPFQWEDLAAAIRRFHEARGPGSVS